MAEEFIISEDVLVSVQETFLDGVKCIKLNFKNNPPKFQEVDFADAEDVDIFIYFPSRVKIFAWYAFVSLISLNNFPFFFKAIVK